MSLPPYLTNDEIASITRPLKQGKARCRRLRKMGLHVEELPTGQPLVGRAHFEEVMRGRPPAANDPAPAAGRDWSKLREKVRYGRGAAQKGR